MASCRSLVTFHGTVIQMAGQHICSSTSALKGCDTSISLAEMMAVGGSAYETSRKYLTEPGGWHK